MTTALDSQHDQHDPLMPATTQVMPGRRGYIPAWGNQHRDLGRQLLRDGQPTGFTLRDVLPERRWAVNTDGNIMDQRDFEPLYQRWASVIVDGETGRLKPIVEMDPHYNPQFESKPEVRAWVMRTIDAGGNEVPLGFSEADEKSSGPTRFFDSSGENPLTAAETLRVYKSKDAMQEILKVEPLKAVLPADQYQGRVDAILKKHGISVEDLALGLAEAPSGFDQVKVVPEDIERLKDLAAREADGLEAEKASAASAPEAGSQPGEHGPESADTGSPSPAPLFVAPCGRECKTKAGVSAHSRNCPKCLSVEATG